MDASARLGPSYPWYHGQVSPDPWDSNGYFRSSRLYDHCLRCFLQAKVPPNIPDIIGKYHFLTTYDRLYLCSCVRANVLAFAWSCRSSIRARHVRNIRNNLIYSRQGQLVYLIKHNVDVRSNMNQLNNGVRTLVLLGLEGVGINIFQPERKQSHGIARLK